MTKKIEARESVGYQATWTIGSAGAAVDITDWVFKATFERQAGAPDFTLNMAAGGVYDAAVEGFSIVDGAAGMMGVVILPATLQAIVDTTGDFTLDSDLLATPPGSARLLVDVLQLRVTKGPTE